MKILYYIYQICIALPILLVLTILTAVVTIVGSLLGGAHIWGYYPVKERAPSGKTTNDTPSFRESLA